MYRQLSFLLVFPQSHFLLSLFGDKLSLNWWVPFLEHTYRVALQNNTGLQEMG